MPNETAAMSSLYARMAGVFVPHPRFVGLLDDIRATIALHGASDELPCLHVSGPSGAGKTTLVKKLMASYPVERDARRFSNPPFEDATADHIPVLRIEMPPQPTVVSVGQEMLKEFGDPNWFKGSRTSVERRVDLYTARCGTRCFVIDEAQRTVDRNGTVVKADLADWFKKRHAETGTILVLVGLGRLSYLFERDAQIKRRWNAELRLQPYQWTRDGVDHVDDQDDFISILAAVRDISPIPFAAQADVEQADDKAATDVAKRFFYASQGLVGLLMKLFKGAVQIAMRWPERHPEMDFVLLHEAFERSFRYRQDGMVNPFGPAWAQQLPPPIQNDTLLLNPLPRKRPVKRAAQRRRELVEVLSKT